MSIGAMSLEHGADVANAALSGDEAVVEVINRGNARYVADVPAAIAFLRELRDAYVSRYNKELERKSASSK